MYTIEFKNSVKKDLKKIDKRRIKAIFNEILKLQTRIEDNDNVIKLKGNNPYYRLRTGDYRVIFEKFDNRLVISIVKIGHRKDVYNKI